MMKLKWPRGRYNRARIVGFEIKLHFDIHKPFAWVLPDGYGRCLGVGPFRLWVSWAYDFDEPPEG